MDTLETAVLKKLENYRKILTKAKDDLRSTHYAASKMIGLLKELGLPDDDSIEINTILEKFDYDNQSNPFVQLIEVLAATRLIEDSEYWIENGERIKERKAERDEYCKRNKLNGEKDYEIEFIEGDVDKGTKDTTVIWYNSLPLDEDGSGCDLVEEKDEVARITQLIVNPSVWVSSQGFFSDSRSTLIEWAKLNY